MTCDALSSVSSGPQIFTSFVISFLYTDKKFSSTSDATSLSVQRTGDCLEPLPLDGRPDFCIGVAEGADQRRDFHGCFDVRRLKNVHVIAASKDGVAAQPAHARTPGFNLLNGRAFQLLEILRRTGRSRRQMRQHDEGTHNKPPYGTKTKI